VDPEVVRFLNERFSRQGGAALAGRERREPTMSWDELRAMIDSTRADHERHVRDNLWMLFLPGRAASPAMGVAADPGALGRVAKFAGAIGKASKHGYRRVQLSNLGAPEALRNKLYPERLRRVLRRREFRNEKMSDLLGVAWLGDALGNAGQLRESARENIGNVARELMRWPP
jgi:hypothetical protein